MSAWKYKQLMPKLIVYKLNLMDTKRITGLVGSSLFQISFVLQNSPYKPEVVEVNTKELTSISLEAALQKNFIKTCENLMTLSPKGIRSLISGLLLKFEANCVKTLLRAKEAKLSVEESMNYVVPVGNLDELTCRKILENSENIEDVIEFLSDFEYGLLLEKEFEVYLKTKLFYVLEVALDRYVYCNLWNQARKLWGLDKKIAKTVIGLEVDALNIKTVFRCKKMGLSHQQIQQYLIPVSSVLGEKELNEAITASGNQSTIESLIKSAKYALSRDHQYIFAELQDLDLTSLTTLETFLDRGLLETNLRMLKRHTAYFNIGLLLAYLNLKWFEIKNLRSIIRASEAGILSEKVKKLLILPR
ncbi:MAG: V-type ATPase subunit [Candidatus Bathyarchaeota archaeon]|nr:MAG: V-type ATPase subunit [Candidatus Bathyarchaeum tardum]WNZ30198.1 MAG: V-type ATPase subunit [Candidatus Bathyarchaeota archaeon]